jgi:hypothetical protein
VRSKLDWALHWAAKGFLVFPCVPGGKAPATANGYKAGTTDQEQIKRWWTGNCDYNVGIWTKGLVVIDVDVKRGKPGLASFFDLGIESDTLTQQTPSGGLHYIYRAEGFGNTASKLGQGLDTRGETGYILATGSELDGEGPYSLLNDAEVLPLPECVSTLLRAPTVRKKVILDIESDTPGAVEQARAYLEQAKPAIEGDGGDEHTYRVACQCRDLGVSEDMALELMLDHWNDWCQPPWDVDELAVKVANAYAYASGTAGVKSVEAEFGGISIEPPVKVRLKSKFIMAGDPIEDDDAAWLFYEKFPRRGVGMIVSPPNAGKTFFTMKLAECLATGEPFYGTAPDEKCATLVLATEGQFGLKKRLSAYEGLPFGALPIESLGGLDALKALNEAIVEFKQDMLARFGARLGLIALETLSSSRLVEDENSNSEMARAIKVLEKIAEVHDCLVVFTHHTPKSSTGARGAGASFGGADVVVEIFREGEKPIRYVNCTKGRDGPTGRWGSFTLDVIDLGPDRKGRPRTTCTLSMGAETEPFKDTKVPANYDSFMAAFDHARSNNGLGKYDPITKEDLRWSFKELCPHIKDVTNPFKRVLAFAIETYAVTASRDGDVDFYNDRRPAIGEA